MTIKTIKEKKQTTQYNNKNKTKKQYNQQKNNNKKTPTKKTKKNGLWPSLEKGLISILDSFFFVVFLCGSGVYKWPKTNLTDCIASLFRECKTNSRNILFVSGWTKTNKLTLFQVCFGSAKH